MGLLDYVRDILVIKISSTSSTNNSNKNRGHAPVGTILLSHILSHLNSMTNLWGDALIFTVWLSQRHQLGVVEPEFNQVVWLQSRALSSFQNKEHQEGAQRVKCMVTQVLRSDFHDNSVLQAWSTSSWLSSVPGVRPFRWWSFRHHLRNERFVLSDTRWWWLHVSISPSSLFPLHEELSEDGKP